VAARKKQDSSPRTLDREEQNILQIGTLYKNSVTSSRKSKSKSLRGSPKTFVGSPSALLSGEPFKAVNFREMILRIAEQREKSSP